ncbi:acetylglutamate kinase [bacterium]|nr:acetylglutamate kinase [bacterium]
MAIVVKLGGKVLENLIENPKLITGWNKVSEPLCFVHGGGAAINQTAEKLGLKFSFVDGQRVSSPEVVDVVEMVLRGKMNPALVRCLEKNGLNALGVCASDAKILECELEEPRLGLVGKIKKTNAKPLRLLIENAYVPVVAPLGSYKSETRDIVNCNADVGALAISSALKASTLIFLSDTDGVLDKDKNNIPHLNASKIQELVDDETIQGGMHIKIRSILNFLGTDSEKEVWIVNGLKSFDMAHLLKSKGSEYGTRITYS